VLFHHCWVYRMSIIKRTFNKSAGFTLTELLVALVINVLVLTSLLGLFIANLNHYTTAIATNRLNQQLQAVMQLMVSDIRRAGYWASSANLVGTDTNSNPFMAAATNESVGGTANSCIIFTYDHASTGTLPSVSTTADDDRYGYRLMNGAIQSRPWGATFSCGASATSWENVTDATVTITGLTFTLSTQTVTTGLGTSALTTRSVDISLTGALASNAAITKTLTQHVRIRNDYFTP
jgi:prepilin peptidase dependent protein B